jgi:hypothetical protein
MMVLGGPRKVLRALDFLPALLFGLVFGMFFGFFPGILAFPRDGTIVFGRAVYGTPVGD